MSGKLLKPEDLIFHNSDLPSPPTLLRELNRLAADPTTDSDDFARLIEQDPGLVARLLRIVNSPFYGLRQKVSDTSLAISLLGLTELRNLVTATTLIERFQGLTNPLTTMDAFWRRSLGCAALSQQVAQASSFPDGNDSLFVTTLLHEVGHLLMYREIPEIMQKILVGQDQEHQRPFWQEEQAVLGFDYAEVGALLLECWFLPEPLYQGIRFHSRPADTKTYRPQAAKVSLCVRLGNLDRLDIADIEASLPETNPLWGMAGIAPAPWSPSLETLKETLATFSLF